MPSFEWLTKHIAAIFVVVIALGSSFAYNIHWARELNARELELKTAEMKLNVTMEKASDATLELENIQKETKSLQEEIRQKQLRLATLEATLSDRAEQITDETEIKRIMSEVSNLGVDLSGSPPCGNPELLSKYFRGKALLHEIAQRALAAQVYDKYKGFINSFRNNNVIVNLDEETDCNSKELRLKASSH